MFKRPLEDPGYQNSLSTNNNYAVLLLAASHQQNIKCYQTEWIQAYTVYQKRKKPKLYQGSILFFVVNLLLGQIFPDFTLLACYNHLYIVRIV